MEICMANNDKLVVLMVISQFKTMNNILREIIINFNFKIWWFINIYLKINMIL